MYTVIGVSMRRPYLHLIFMKINSMCPNYIKVAWNVINLAFIDEE